MILETSEKNIKNADVESVISNIMTSIEDRNNDQFTIDFIKYKIFPVLVHLSSRDMLKDKHEQIEILMQQAFPRKHVRSVFLLLTEGKLVLNLIVNLFS